VEKAVQHAQVVPGLVREPVPDHHRLHVEVHQRRDHRVFEAGHHDEVVAELVLRTTQPPQLLPQFRLLAGLDLPHDQHLEVRPRGRAGRSTCSSTKAPIRASASASRPIAAGSAPACRIASANVSHVPGRAPDAVVTM